MADLASALAFDGGAADDLAWRMGTVFAGAENADLRRKHADNSRNSNKEGFAMISSAPVLLARPLSEKLEKAR